MESFHAWLDRELKARGRGAAAALANALEISLDKVSKMRREGGRQPAPRELPVIEAFFGKPSPYTASATEAEREPPPSRPTPNASPPVPIQMPTETIPVYGQAVGGEDGRFVLNGQRLVDLMCPPNLVGVPGAYGVFVHGDSMYPRYRSGETVFVHPRLPVSRGDDVVVQIFEGDGESPSGFVKEFVALTAKELVLKQHQPRETEESLEGEEQYLLRFPRDRVVAVHKIVWRGSQ